MGMSRPRDQKGEKDLIGTERKLAYPVQMLSMYGDIEGILEGIMSGKGMKKVVIKRTLDILIGLSLKGYEGKTVGAIFLIGDIEGIRRYSTQMIINPFRGWKDINVLDEKQQLTFESFSQLDGAFVLDHRGFAHYAGRMIHVKNENDCEQRRDMSGNDDRGGTGTRWRAAKYITERTKTVAVSLSNRGDITVFERGKEIGRIQRRVLIVDPGKIDMLLMEDLHR